MQQYCDCLIFNSEGKLLLLLRSEVSTIEPNKWCLPGGHQDPGEELNFSCFREVLEETAIELDLVEHLSTLDNPDGSSSHYFITDTISFDQTKNIIIDPFEHKGYGFFSLDEIEELELLFDLKDRLFTHFFDYLVSKQISSQLSKIFSKPNLTPEEDIAFSKGDHDFTIKSFQDYLFNKGLIPEDFYLENIVGQKNENEYVKVLLPIENKTDFFFVQSKELEKAIDYSIHAKGASEIALMNALKRAKEESVRLAAQKELKRRKKEEYEEEDGIEQNEDKFLDFTQKEPSFCDKYFEDMLENFGDRSILMFYRNDINNKIIQNPGLLTSFDREIISDINELFDEATVMNPIKLYKNIVKDSDEVSDFFAGLKPGAIYKDSLYPTLFTGVDFSMSTMYDKMTILIDKGKRLLPVKKDSDSDIYYFMLPKNSIFKVISNNSEGLTVELI